MDRFEIEKSERWSNICRRIPYLNFDFKCEVKITPPFGGAVARMRVKTQMGEVSVYLDWFDKLGGVGEPYWELYPNKEGDCSRYLLEETDGLMYEIKKLLT